MVSKSLSGFDKLQKAWARKAKRKAKRKTLYSGKPTLDSRAILRAKLDSLWGFFIRLRDKMLHGPWCRICTLEYGEVAYHLIPKQRGDAVRWLPENGVLACSSCNYGEMVRRADYRDKHVKLFGKELIEGLEEKARRWAKFSRSDLAAMADDLRRSIERLGTNGARQEPDGPGARKEDTQEHGQEKPRQAPKEPGLPVADDGAGEGPDVLHGGQAAEGDSRG